LPVVARHNAARISLENSGVIGSLGELTPNILMASLLFFCKSRKYFLYHQIPEALFFLHLYRTVDKAQGHPVILFDILSAVAN
jgi:hypothetical protein